MPKELESKRLLFILSLVFILCVFILIFVFSRDTNSYLLVDGITKWRYDGHKYSVLQTDTPYIGYEFDIFSQKDHFGKQKIEKTADGFLKYTNLVLGNQYLGIRSKGAYASAHFEVETLNQNDLKELNHLLQERGITKYGQLTLNQKVLFDLDDDHFLEQIYSVSNYCYNCSDHQYFNLVYILDDENYVFLVDEVTNKKDASFMGLYQLEYLFSLKKKNYNLILSYHDFDSDGHALYEYDGKQQRQLLNWDT